MKRLFKTSLAFFMAASMLVAYALPTMAGRLRSYDSSTGIMILEMEDKSQKKFKVTEKTTCDWVGKDTSLSSLRVGSKISVQIAGALNVSPLNASKIVDWASSNKIVAKGAAAPYYTKESAYVTSAGGGGLPDGAPVGGNNAHHVQGAVAHGGSQNALTPGSGSHGASSPHYSNGSGNGTTHFRNQGEAVTSTLGLTNGSPHSQGTQFGQFGTESNDIATMMGVEGTGSVGIPGVDGTAFGGSTQQISGRVMNSALEQGYITIQSFQDQNPQRVLLGEAAGVSPQLLVAGQMIEVTGTQGPQGFKAVEIKPLNTGF